MTPISSQDTNMPQCRNCNQALYLRYAPVTAQTDDGSILRNILPAQLQSV